MLERMLVYCNILPFHQSHWLRVPVDTFGIEIPSDVVVFHLDHDQNKIWTSQPTVTTNRELREFSNFAKTRVRLLSFHLFHFTMLLTGRRMCCDNILTSVFATLIFLTLNPSAHQILRDSFFPVRFHHHNSIKRLIPSYRQQEVFFCLHYILLNIILRIQSTHFRSLLVLPFILP